MSTQVTEANSKAIFAATVHVYTARNAAKALELAEHRLHLLGLTEGKTLSMTRYDCRHDGEEYIFNFGNEDNLG